MSLVHRVRPPRAASRRPPLAILVHGLGADEHDLFGLAPWLDPRLVVVSVRAPREAFPMGHSWFDIDFSQDPPRLDLGHVIQSRDLLVRFAGEAAQAHGADPSRIFLVGFSQGATLGMACAMAHPRTFRGLVAHSGRACVRAQPGEAPTDLAGFPVLVQHGSADPVVPVSFGHEARDLLAGLGMDVSFAEYPIGHEISPQSLADLAGWLTARIDATEAA
ncbi:MAG TPA: prolyl oligopeptidase family serine peptidase [Anaeromyxobacteraceae bacterium]|nr:prolyl oligopeptidase family serine peptidase [Anaeromyxobacteraceae bacterium]